MQDADTLENVVVELAGAVETCLGARTKTEMQPSLEQVKKAVDEVLVGIDQTKDARTVEGIPVRECFEQMQHAVDACLAAPEVEPVKHTLAEMVCALRQVERELKA
jgi:hypothetical protein